MEKVIELCGEGKMGSSGELIQFAGRVCGRGFAGWGTRSNTLPDVTRVVNGIGTTDRHGTIYDSGVRGLKPSPSPPNHLEYS